VLGALVIVNLLIEQRRAPGRRGQPSEGPMLHAVKVAGTFLLITTLWSLWNAPTVGEWFDVLTWWQIG
jgi:hypothetical protein